MPSPRFLLFVAWLFAVASARGETAAGSYQAATWDRDITLPVDAYRAPKPIDLKGNFTVKTQAGTLVDAVSFQGREDRQHYHMEGTQFRRCRFGVKMGGSGHGIDSVYEDCTFNKDDAWFVAWWSTRWMFDNCIFTRQFVRNDLSPGDYAAHAMRCTFYGVKLPTVGFKEDPAAYLQKGDLGFVQCRFVDCDVPQSFLAATVDCIFENCRFEAKNKLVWPKEASAIKVRAYYPGGGTEQASFVNGPLSVTFEKAPLKGEFGSTVAHTQSGGKVTLTSQRLSGQFTLLGSTPRKASEIDDARPGDPSARPAAPGVGASPEAQVLGNWTVLTRANGAHYDQTFVANHSVTEKGQRIGSWEIKGKQLAVSFDGKSYGDVYELPPRDGALYGQSTEGIPMMMGRVNDPTPPALLASIVGRWDYLRLDGKDHLTLTFGADRTVNAPDGLKARWRTVGKTLLLDWEGHGDWHDIFLLPGDDGALMGVNGSHTALMLSRLNPEAGETKKADPASYFGAPGTP